MNEFTGKSKEHLEIIRNAMEAYMQGCIDGLKIIESTLKETSYKTQKMYEEKIKLCQEEIDKLDQNKS